MAGAGTATGCVAIVINLDSLCNWLFFLPPPLPRHGYPHPSLLRPPRPEIRPLMYSLRESNRSPARRLSFLAKHCKVFCGRYGRYYRNGELFKWVCVSYLTSFTSFHFIVQKNNHLNEKIPISKKISILNSKLVVYRNSPPPTQN